MDTFLTAFGAHFFATIAIRVIGYAGQKFKKDTAGTQKEKAIERCISTAVVVFYTTAETQVKEDSDLLMTITKKFFNQDDVAREIASLLKGNKLDRKEILYLFEQSGYDAETLPGLDFEFIITAFEAAFVAAAIEEPILQGIIQTEHIIKQSEIQQQMLDEMKKLYAFIQNSQFESLKSVNGLLQAIDKKTKRSVTYKQIFSSTTNNKITANHVS